MNTALAAAILEDYVLGMCHDVWGVGKVMNYVRWAVDVDMNETKVSYENYNTFGYLHIETLMLNVLKAVGEARAALLSEENV